MSGIVDKAVANSTNTYMEYNSNLSLINYVSEGFMSKYRYRFGSKKTSTWKRIGTYALIGAIAVVGVVGSIFTAGAAGAGAAAGITAVIGSSIALSTTIIATSVVGLVSTIDLIASSIEENKWANRAQEAHANGREVSLPHGVL